MTTAALDRLFSSSGASRTPIERGEIAAADLRRALDGLVLRGQPRQVGPRTHALHFGPEVVVGLDRERVDVGLDRALEIAAGVEQVANLRQRSRVAGLERHRLAEVLQRLVGGALLTFDGGELAIQERTIGGAGNRAVVERDRVIHAPGPRRLSRAIQVVLLAAEPQHLDAPRQIRQRRIDGQRRLECRQRVGLPVQRQQRLPASDQRRQILRLPLERPIEVRQRRLHVLARDLQPAQGRRCRIECRRRLQRRVELPFRALQLAGLKQAPAEIMIAGRGCSDQIRRDDRHDELGKLRRRDHRSDHRRARPRTGGDRRKQHEAGESAHLENVTAIRGG